MTNNEKKTGASRSRKRDAEAPGDGQRKKSATSASCPDGGTGRRTRFPIVGIGTSAGGVTALKDLFDRMPPDSGLGFVVVQHMDPQHESHMPEVLTHHTTMPVVEVRDNMPIEPNRIHLIPPNTSMTIQGGTLHLGEAQRADGEQGSGTVIAHDENATIAQLKDKLRRTREELESTIERLETANEELTTINHQLEDKVAELTATTDDLDNLLNSTNISTIFLDREFRIRRFTTATTRLVRLIEADVGRRVSDIASSVWGNTLIEDAEQVLARLHMIEREVRTDDKWYIRRVQPFRTRDDHIEGVVITFIDITERKTREEQFARLAAIVESSDDAIFSHDKAGTILTWNKGAENMFGYSENEAVGGHVSLIVPTDDEDAHDQLMRNINAGHPVRRMEVVRVARDGRQLHVSFTISALCDNDGNITAFSVVGRDISRHRERESKILQLARDLQRRFDELNAVLQVAPVGIYIAHDAECRQITTNPAGAAILGMDPDDNISLTGPDSERLPFRVFHEGRELAPHDLPLQRVARDGIKLYGYEDEIRFGDGRRVQLLMNAAPLFDEDGKTRGAIGVFMDITDRKKAEAELHRHTQQMREADRRKDAFLAVLGHELRNPLAAMRYMIDLLQAERGKFGEPVQDSLNVIDRQTHQLTRLVDDLLDVARITRDDVRLKRNVIVLNDVVRDVCESMRPLCESRRQILDLEAPPEPLKTFADPVRISQVITNLVTNASNYSSENSSIRVCLAAADGHAVIRVIDNGTGIPPEQLDEIFAPFSRGGGKEIHSGKQGVGLGLTLARRLIQTHGGTLTAHSEGPGTGAEFVIKLPLPAPATNTGTSDNRPDIPAESPQRILIVEDNTDAGHALATLLAQRGHSVRVVASGREAIKECSMFRPRIAFIDIGLPDMNGYEVGRTLRQRCDGLPLRMIALSGYGRNLFPDRGTTSPFDDYLMKPLTTDKLRTVLQNISDIP